MANDHEFDHLPEELALRIEGRRGSARFREKPTDEQRLINEALDLLTAFGVPLDDTQFACGRGLHLIRPFEAGVLVPANPDSSRNDPTRRWVLSDEFAPAVRAYGTPGFAVALGRVMAGRTKLAAQWTAERELARVPIEVAPGVELSFGPGPHNQLFKAVIEQFLPRFGRGAQVLYVGDAEKRDLYKDEHGLREIGFFELDHAELPDVVAYSRPAGWLFVIEAVHSSGPMSHIRVARLRELLKDSPAGVVFVTAFADRATFRKFVPEIAWETEVWISSDPDHLIHFNGDRFLGPHAQQQTV